MTVSLVIMGVAGCGKSSLGAALATALGCAGVEGDDFHSAESRAKMAAGVPLTDADRMGWLERLGAELQRQPAAVMTCSALRRAYRDRLRQASPALRFVWLALEPEVAARRVAARAGQHFFSPALVASQFATLESPEGEAGVLKLDAIQPLPALVAQVQAWLADGTAGAPHAVPSAPQPGASA